MMSALGQYGEKIHKKVKNAVEIAAAEQQRLRLSKGLLHLLLAWSAQMPLVAHRVNRRTAGYKHYMHPVVGELRLDCDTWDNCEGGGQRLMCSLPIRERPRTTDSASSLPGP
jgi:hypothetical protein